MNGNIAMELRPGFSERITATSNVQRVTCSLPRPYHGPLTRDIVLFTYSWIGRPVQTYKKIICRETERATTDLNIRMKSSRRGASNGAGHIFITSVFGELFLKIDEKCPKKVCAPHSWMRLV